MIKRLSVAVAALLALGSQAFTAGTIPGFSLTPQFDLTGKAAPGCKLFVIQAGTVSTPQNAYQDSGLTLLQPNPLTCDAASRLPQFFVADGTIKVRLTKSDGTQIFVGDNLLVVGASSGGGGGSPVDPTTILQTGYVQTYYGTGILSGFVRMNGRTIGSATSGASERANADTSALFSFLWNADPNLAVSGGRGANAAADFSANKALTLPDGRSRMVAGLGDMGNSDNGLFSGVTFTSGTSTTLGAFLGASRRTLVTAYLPPYTPAGTNSTSTVTGVAPFILSGGGAPQYAGPGPGGGAVASVTAAAQTFTGTPQGGTSTPFDAISPYGLVTFYIKL